MYSQKFALAVKTSNSVLKEIDDTVYLPFGSEYSILLKNLNNVRAAATVEIDGEDVAGGYMLIVDPNSSIELERFIKHGNLQRGNRFKFIRRSSAVEKARGIRVDDGIVRVEVWFEKPNPIYYTPAPHLPWNPTPFNPDPWNQWGTTSDGLIRGVSGNGAGIIGSNYLSNSSNVGITAPGSISDQQFTTVSGLNLEATSSVMVLKLLGRSEHAGRVKLVSRPHTTKTRRTCITCRHSNRSGSKFCEGCGTSLEIV